MEFENTLEKFILDLYEIEGVKFGTYTLKSGMKSPVYMDLRVIVSYPTLMNSLTDLIVKILQNSELKNVQHICGVPYTALPMATLVSSRLGMPMLIRRKETKNYGTKKLIEGKFKEGDHCIILEDVITSGASIIETMQDLEKESLKVVGTIIVLDREQGGYQNLLDTGIKVQAITSLSKVLKTLLKHKKISEETVKEVEKFIATNRVENATNDIKNSIGTNRLTMSFQDRAKYTKNELSVKIFQLMELKKTNLCVAADVTKSADLLKLAAQVGQHICILKTHYDAVEDFSENTSKELLKLAKTYNFLIMEDRKFADIGNTVSLQYNHIKRWTSLVTAHSISGEGVLIALKSSIGNEADKGCFLVAELSCAGNLINNDYAQATLKMAENHADFVVGLVCQSPSIIKVPHLIQLTPGVKIDEKTDNLGQNYNDPEFVVLEKGADIAVVGRGIVVSSNPEKSASTYKKRLWDAYEKRIGRSNS